MLWKPKVGLAMQNVILIQKMFGKSPLGTSFPCILFVISCFTVPNTVPTFLCLHLKLSGFVTFKIITITTFRCPGYLPESWFPCYFYASTRTIFL